MNAVVHTIHVVLAGVWLGGVIFTTAVVSPALKAMGWDEVERVGVRSVIGRQYARVGGANLALLVLFALLDGWTAGFGLFLYVELTLLTMILCLVAAHGGYLGRKLAALAEAEKKAGEQAGFYAGRRRALQRVSVRISMLTMALSAAVAVLAANA